MRSGIWRSGNNRERVVPYAVYRIPHVASLHWKGQIGRTTHEIRNTKYGIRFSESEVTVYAASILASAGLDPAALRTGDLGVHSPIDGAPLGRLHSDTHEEIDRKIAGATDAFLNWRMVPAPRRGELVRLFADELRASRQALGELVTLESGKILQEGLGEVQEMIDICDFAVGLTRQLYGLTMPSERPGHRIAEYWHPVGPVAVITAFNFPVAVWAWNAALALACGDSVLWKPSPKTPLTALACETLLFRAMQRFGAAPEGLSQILIGGPAAALHLAGDARIPVISATGSTAMGRELAPVVARRMGRSILELGGNNAMIVTPSADLDLALRAILFSAVGTAGQRCTSLRRLIVHHSLRDELLRRLSTIYAQVKVGNPFAAGTLVGPLIDGASFDRAQAALNRLRADGVSVSGGERVSVPGCEGGHYMRPAIAPLRADHPLLQSETFAPILYIVEYDQLEQAVAIHNNVPQGLSSCVFTRDLAEAEIFLSTRGSDCGIANVNIGPSGAEIGGAFGGEKDTGGGRESGSDAWKAYMRRMTATINYSAEIPLAQGIRFETGE
ncbi:MAG: aldehyde dehydrogenase family protein [Gammaproteobacteria bacterium]|nr:aldehyde dehydrogenase family protein [Gammaproteobacteria bacterium]